MARAGVRRAEFPSRDAWDCCLQNNWKAKARMKCMMGGGESIDDEMVDASDGDVGGDA
jgi:hypothetical protein